MDFNPFEVTGRLWGMSNLRWLVILEWVLVSPLVIGAIYLAAGNLIRTWDKDFDIKWISNVIHWHYFVWVVFVLVLITVPLGLFLSFKSATSTASTQNSGQLSIPITNNGINNGAMVGINLGQINVGNSSIPPLVMDARQKDQSVSVTIGWMIFKNTISQLSINHQSFNIGDLKLLDIYTEINTLFVDAHLYGKDNNLSIELKHGQLLSAPQGWDMNSDQDAFEVVDDKQNVVFQLIQKAPYEMLINGYISFPGGYIFSNEGKLYSEGMTPNLRGDGIINFSINKIFKYPSSQYQGVLKGKRCKLWQVKVEDSVNSSCESGHNGDYNRHDVNPKSPTRDLSTWQGVAQAQ